MAAGLLLAEGAFSFALAVDPEALIQQGVDLRRQKKDEAALKLFEQAYALQAGPKAAAQIGLAQQALGRWVKADKHLREALSATRDPWINKNRAALQEDAEAVARHVGHLEVSGSPVGAEVVVDGELVGRLPLPDTVAVNAGTVAVEVRAPGYLSILRGASIAGGDLARENIQLQRLTPASLSASAGREAGHADSGGKTESETGATAGTASSAASLPAAGSPEPGGTRRALTYGAAGLAGAAVIFGVVEQLSWQKKVQSFNDNAACNAMLAARGAAGCQSTYDAGQSAKRLALVGYGLGAGFAVTAAILFLTAPEPGGHDGASAMACAVGDLRAGVSCSFRF